MKDFVIPLPSGEMALVRVPFPMTSDDYQQITSTLLNWKKALVEPEKTKEPTGANI